MLEFDYLIERNDGINITKYEPKIDKKLSNLVSISGPNDSGKSTLLNLIALGFFGLENKRINPSLIERMKSLTESDHQKLKFEIIITKNNGKLQILSKKPDLNDNEISMFEKTDGGDFKRITKDYFDKKYILIYDIPDNPTGRIKELNHDLLFRQQKVGDKIKSLNDYVRDVITEINNSKDPKKIVELKEASEKFSAYIEEKKGQRDVIKKELKAVEEYTYSRFYLEYKDIYEETERNFKNADKPNKKSKRTNSILRKEKDFLHEGNQLLDEIDSGLIKTRSGLKKIIPNEAKNIINLWDRINLKEVLYEKDDNDILIKGICEARKILLLEIESDNKNPDIDKANLLSDLINLLNDYRDLNTSIPGIEKNIPEFINILEQEFKEFEILKKVVGYKRKLLELVENIEEKRASFIAYFAEKMQDIEDNLPIEEELLEEDDLEIYINDLKAKMSRYKNKFENYEKLLGKANININKAKSVYTDYENDNSFLSYKIMGEKELDSQITDFNKNIAEIIKEVSEDEFRLRKMQTDILRLERLEPHKYQDHLEELNMLFTRTQMLEQKIRREFSEYLNDLIKEKVNLKKINDHQRTYYEKIAIFLGRKIGGIRHEEADYKILKVNVLNKEIVTVNGKIIKYTDLGTGQGQAAYLRGLLNLKDDNRSVIALIDEVAMMDSNSLQIVYDSLKELEKDGKLLLGIVVQRSDELKIEPIN